MHGYLRRFQRAFDKGVFSRNGSERLRKVLRGNFCGGARSRSFDDAFLSGADRVKSEKRTKFSFVETKFLNLRHKKQIVKKILKIHAEKIEKSY